MRKIMILLTIVATLAMSATSPFKATKARTRNQSSKVQFTEAFIFPNDCTNELMDVADTTTISCHDQQRADGSFSEKCEIPQDVTAVGQTTGITWQGTPPFKHTAVPTHYCTFSSHKRS